MIEPASTARAGSVAAAGGTDPGRVRSQNEDRLYVDVDRGIFLVADGVGGHAAGEVAATIAVDVIVQRLARPTWSAEQRVREAIALANSEILKQSETSPAYVGMTCVLTLAVVTDQRVTIGHVGDSRLYKLGPRGIVKLTHDHSPVGEREDAHELSEVEAMQHPRRNEVFRDVGSAFHEPDDPEFIEIIETAFEPESALLLCSDGLSDLVASPAIERVVRQHAGDPAAVVAALIEAANDAGGKDNVTVVYVEGNRFASTPRLVPAPVAPIRGTAPEVEFEEDGLSLVLAGLKTAMRSRTAFLASGLLLGLIVGLGLAFLPALDAYFPNRGRTLRVGADGGDYPTIAAAMQSARARDIVQVEPGEYSEAVIVKDGVSLAARVPGTVILAPQSRQAAWIGVVAGGRLGSRISGITVVGRPNAPIEIGFRLAGHDLVVDDVSVEGNVKVGMDIVNDGAILIRSSRLDGVRGVAMRVGPMARPVIRHNVFIRGTAAEEAISLADDAMPEVDQNVFAGFAEPIAPPSRRALLENNFTIRGADYGHSRTERP